MKPVVNVLVCLLMIAFVCMGCMGTKKPWRDYSKKKFDVKEWRDGDALERGRMYLDMHKNRIVEGKSRDDVLKVLSITAFPKPGVIQFTAKRKRLLKLLNNGFARSANFETKCFHFH